MTAPLAHGGFAGSYEVARRHLADRSRLRALIDGTDTVECDDDPRCPVCGVWLGCGEDGWCSTCQFGDRSDLDA